MLNSPHGMLGPDRRPQKMNRGDTLHLGIMVPEGYDCMNFEIHELQPRERLYVSITKPHQRFEDGMVRKILTVDDVDMFGVPYLDLDSKDTEFFEEGRYYIEVKLAEYDEDGTTERKVWTVIPKTIFDVI